MKKIKFVLVAGIIGMIVSCGSRTEMEPVRIIPQPDKLKENSGTPFVISEKSKILVNDAAALPVAEYLNAVLKTDLQILLQDKVKLSKLDIVLELDDKLDSLTDEGYRLQISDEGVYAESSGPQGLFYAVQSIRQMLPPELENEKIDNLVLPDVEISDSPGFPWRGIHLDVSRHFMPLEFIKKYIDYLALHKLNVFHWHLVDGIGWRIEIKSHPELTDIGAWRVVKEGKKPWQDYEVWREGDARPKYGGYYTQEEIREVVAYAKERYITVLPEIELPGHSEVVFQCYPDLVCKDANHDHLENIGVYCASNPGSYQLLEEVLDEVLELFPSEYIHIGGDEVNKGNWEKCVDCTRLMKQNGYSPDELQSYFVNHFDNYLKKNDRKLIGWHEILEGDLSESATIMYWGGENGVADYVRKGYPTILTTGSHLYFDHYQSLSIHEEKAFGGYAPLKKVYNYEPFPKNLEDKYRNLIIGVQANVWTEYMPTEEKVEYMTIPRMAALAEIAWQKEGDKDWERFRIKMDKMLHRYQAMGVNYAKSSFRPDIQFELDNETRNLTVSMESELISDLYFTLDGSEPNPETSSEYTGPFMLEKSTTVKAVAARGDKLMVEAETKDAVLHKARGVKVILEPEATGKYSAKGGATLVDTDFGGNKWGNGKWLGILSRDFSSTFEFDEPTKVSKIGYSCIEETQAGIYFPEGLDISVSNDGISWEKVSSWETARVTPIPKSPDIHTKTIELAFDAVECKFLKVFTKYQRVPDSGVFTFVDEIIVE